MIFYSKNKEKISYTINHRKAFVDIEKKLLGKNTIRGYLHDLDKIIMCLFLPYRYVKKIHNNFSRHHNRACTKEDYTQMIIDWECARFTKPDKPLNARDTLSKHYKYLSEEILPILDELGL